MSALPDTARLAHADLDADTLRAELPTPMLEARRWLLWRHAMRNGKPTKVPYYASGVKRGVDLDLDSPEDAAQFDTFDNALRAFATGHYSGIGFALGPDENGHHWQGIDLDKIQETPGLAELVKDLPGYVERSPSRNGYHAIGYGLEFPALGSNETNIEAYSRGRYFTVTGEAIGGDLEDLSGFVTGKLAPMHQRKRKGSSDSQAGKVHVTTDQVCDLRSALNRMRSDGRDLWIRMAHALHELGDTGRGLWLDWSKTSEKFDPADAARVWDSIKSADRTGYAAVFAAAQEAGWVNPAAGSGGVKEGGKPPRKPRPPTSGDPCDWTREFIVSDEEISKLKRPEWIIRNLVIRGHLVIVVAEPNGGKTTIFAHLGTGMVQAGYRVFYVNADISGSDAAEFIETAKAGNWTALLPDLIPGMSMQDVIERLQEMNDQGGDLSKAVFIFDTLKKMTDVIDKKSIKNLLKLLRSLTGKGMTVILLGHTNKYKDADGKPIFEGTGDVRADADELIYLIPQKHADGSMTVSTEPNKVRGDFKPITFHIAANRTVTQGNVYIDTGAASMAQEQYEGDLPDIRVILDAIEAGMHKQTEILEHCRTHKIGKRTALRILRDYGDGRHKQWESQRAFEKNMIRYYPLGTTL